ncbi:hypothetical protein D3C86_1120980 [compost metagenome]
MDIGRAQVVVVMVMMAVLMAVAMMAVVARQQKGTGDVHRQPHHRNHRRFGECHGRWLKQAINGFTGNAESHQPQHHGRGKTREIPDLAGAEAVTRVVGIAPCKPIGRRRDAQGPGMGGHVKTIGQQRHGTGDVTGGNFANHHHKRQRHHP